MAFLLLPIIGHAEVVPHSTGKPMILDNSTYEIQQNLGQTVGTNLFHTFDSFNLNQGEIAHFSGADSIQNIVARVIGGEASFIDGTLKSNLNANLYFLNPYGIMLGANARLDLQGGLHLSTADYVRLGEEGEFHARFPERDILTTAPISSFGFLTNSPAPISITGTEVNQDFGKKYKADYTKAPLQLREQQPFSLTGGDINISSNYYYESDENRQNNIKTPMPFMYIPQGQINFVATNVIGEISINNIEVLENINQFADISLSETKIKNLGGGISIYGMDVTLINTGLFPWVEKNIEVQGNINIIAEANILFNNVVINSTTYGTHNAGSIYMKSGDDIKLQKIELVSRSKKESNGEAGDITIEAGRHFFLEDSYTDTNVKPNITHGISTSTWTKKNAGDIKVTAKHGDINIINSHIFSNAGNEKELEAGDSGYITLEAQSIILDSVEIQTRTKGYGDAGDISLRASNQVGLNGSALYSNTIELV